MIDTTGRVYGIRWNVGRVSPPCLSRVSLNQKSPCRAPFELKIAEGALTPTCYVLLWRPEPQTVWHLALGLTTGLCWVRFCFLSEGLVFLEPAFEISVEPVDPGNVAVLSCMAVRLVTKAVLLVTCFQGPGQSPHTWEATETKWQGT